MTRVSTMLLPDGKTCRDCAHFKRREMLFSANVSFPSSTSCDWAPSRFVEPVRAAVQPKTQRDATLAAFDRLAGGEVV